MGGLTYNGDKYREDLKGFAISRARFFLIPYFAIYFFMMILFLPLSANVGTFLTPWDVFFWFLYGAGPPNQATHLWFLPVLYFGLVFFTIIELATHNLRRETRWLIAVLLPVIAIGIRDSFTPILVPWRISSVLLCTTFCIIGNEMHRARQLKPWSLPSNKQNVLVVLILSIALILSSEVNGFVDIAIDQYGINAWLYIVSGTIGTLIVFMFSATLAMSVRVKRVLLPIGESSQVIYEIHPVFFFMIPLIQYIASMSLETIGVLFNSLWPVRLVVGLAFSLPFAIMLVPRNRILSLIFRGRYEKKE